MDSARALIARGWGVSLVSRCLRVSRAQLHVILRRTDDWMDGRRSRHTDDTDVLLRIHHVIGELPTYGYRRVWALLRRQAELDGMPAINAKRVYRIMRQNALLLERKPAVPPSKRAHTGSIDFPIRLGVTHRYIRAVLVRCNIQRYSPLLRELPR